MPSEEYRSAHAGDLRASDAGNEVRLAGWVNRRRDHGGVIFIDLRDASGVVQVVVNPEEAPASPETLHGLRIEYCIAVGGVVAERPVDTQNADLPTGEIEVVASSLRVLSPSAPLPFQLDGRADVEEVRRLGHRYLDIRTDRMQANLKARSLAVGAMRRVMDDQGFLEVETPTLVASTPEGARDMLVPSRLRRGSFYALPQSPQLFKQLLMIGGVERYYQFARCYRDEDFRADRQVEFTQLDLEGSFWDEEDVLETLEAVVAAAVKSTRGVDVPRPIPRIPYSDAMARFGRDKPDVRFGMEIKNVDDVFADTGFKAFSGTLARRRLGPRHQRREAGSVESRSRQARRPGHRARSQRARLARRRRRRFPALAGRQVPRRGRAGCPRRRRLAPRPETYSCSSPTSRPWSAPCSVRSASTWDGRSVTTSSPSFL